MSRKKSFFEKLTGAINHEPMTSEQGYKHDETLDTSHEDRQVFYEEDNEQTEAELTVDLYDTGNDLVLETMIAGVAPEQIDIQITRDMVTIQGERHTKNTTSREGYYTQELFWGSFTREIALPEEIDPELVSAEEKHGLLTIRMPKKDKHRRHKVRVQAK